VKGRHPSFPRRLESWLFNPAGPWTSGPRLGRQMLPVLEVPTPFWFKRHRGFALYLFWGVVGPPWKLLKGEQKGTGRRVPLVLAARMWYTGRIAGNEARRIVFGISMWEIILIMVVALIFLGPKQLVETARAAGKVYRELLKVTGEIRNSVDLDSLTNPRPTPPTPPRSAPVAGGVDQAGMPPEGHSSGPDFYADLLEQSKEEAPQEKSPPAPSEDKKADAEKEPAPKTAT
jgi:sec-independent protein translocase protein TatB